MASLISSSSFRNIYPTQKTQDVYVQLEKLLKKNSPFTEKSKLVVESFFQQTVEELAILYLQTNNSKYKKLAEKIAGILLNQTYNTATQKILELYKKFFVGENYLDKIESTLDLDDSVKIDPLIANFKAQPLYREIDEMFKNPRECTETKKIWLRLHFSDWYQTNFVQAYPLGRRSIETANDFLDGRNFLSSSDSKHQGSGIAKSYKDEIELTKKLHLYLCSQYLKRIAGAYQERINALVSATKSYTKQTESLSKYTYKIISKVQNEKAEQNFSIKHYTILPLIEEKKKAIDKTEFKAIQKKYGQLNFESNPLKDLKDKQLLFIMGEFNSACETAFFQLIFKVIVLQ